MSAMKNKDNTSLIALRGVKTAIMQYKTSSNFKGNKDSDLDDSEVIKLIQKMVKERKDTANVYKEAGRLELAEKELSEINVIKKYLPQSLSLDKVKELVNEAITEVNAMSIKDIGKVISYVNSKANGGTDGKTISEIFKEILNNK
jgi:uncharacterized protein YqeY